MEPGMITSNDQASISGQWGVRIENLVLNVPTDRSEFGEFCVRDADAVPDRHRLIERTLMRNDEIGWLNAYHDEVRRRVSPLVSGAAAQWLQERTAQFDSARYATLRVARALALKREVSQLRSGAAARSATHNPTLPPCPSLR